jgi:putative transposase
MANTYSQIHIHVVFAVQDRQNLISSKHKDVLQKYIAGIISNRNQKLIAINNMPDHFHILIGQKPDIALSDLVGDIKSGSSGFINKSRWMPGKFAWQEGFGAFSYSHSQLTAVIRYIENQEKHHAKKTFNEEYLGMLNKFKVPHDERYIFKPVDVV